MFICISVATVNPRLSMSTSISVTSERCEGLKDRNYTPLLSDLGTE